MLVSAGRRASRSLRLQLRCSSSRSSGAAHKGSEAGSRAKVLSLTVDGGIQVRRADVYSWLRSEQDDVKLQATRPRFTSDDDSADWLADGKKPGHISNCFSLLLLSRRFIF